MYRASSEICRRAVVALDDAAHVIAENIESFEVAATYATKHGNVELVDYFTAAKKKAKEGLKRARGAADEFRKTRSEIANQALWIAAEAEYWSSLGLNYKGKKRRVGAKAPDPMQFRALANEILRDAA